MLILSQARDDLLSKLGIESFAVAPALAVQDVTIAINGALQTLQTAGQDYFTRQKIAITISAGTALYPISQSIQAVLGPIRLNDSVPLRALLSRGELDQFDRIFEGDTTYGAAQGTPIAYWVENLNSGSGSGDISKMNVYLAPTPQAGGSITLEVVDVAPAYTVTDISAGTAILPVAQGYIESILLPIARMLVTRSSTFSRPNLLPQLTADYQTAMQRLGLAGGFPNAVQDEPERKASG